MSGDYTAGAALPAGELTSGDLAAETTARMNADAALIPKSVVTTKGDLLAATASATVARLGVGADGQVLTADAASTPGVKWATPSGGGGDSLPIADPAGVVIDTTTYDNPVTGEGKIATLVLPTDTAVLAWAVTGDAFPRGLVESEVGVFLGDGTYDPYGGPGISASGSDLNVTCGTGGRVQVLGDKPAAINGHRTLAHADPDTDTPVAGMDGRFVNVGSGAAVVAAYGVNGEAHARLLLYADGRMKVGDGTVDPAGLNTGPIVVQPDGTYLRVVAVDNAGTLGTEPLV